MPLDPADEPPIDTSLHHYMEDKALAIALAKAETEEQKAKLEHLLELQASLMVQREAYTAVAIARRHARGEIYSKARVAAINAMGPNRAAMDASVKSLYQRQPDCEGVLKAHALTHFTSAFASQRIGLSLLPADIASESRTMLEREEAFAAAWIAAVNEPAFAAEVRERRREATALFRTASTAMYCVSFPPLDGLDDEDAIALGKIWKKLDSLADERGTKPLSDFIAFGDEGEEGSVPAGDILPTLVSLQEAVADPAQKFPSRKNALVVLGKLQDLLTRLDALQGRAFFEVDT